MLLHSAEKKIDDKAVTAVLTAAGVDADKARVKALVASLSDVDIGEAMATAVAAPVAAGAPAAVSAPVRYAYGPSLPYNQSRSPRLSRLCSCRSRPP